MTETEYRNRSVSQLVTELNGLGEDKVVVEPLRLLAVQNSDHPAIKLFKNSKG